MINGIEQAGERIFPYFGNSPIFSYSPHDSKEQDGSELLVIVEKCVKFWLKHIYHRKKMKQLLSNMTLAKEGIYEVIQFSRVPELLTVSELNIGIKKKGIIVYPDPPVGTLEMKVLMNINNFQYLSLTEAMGSSKFKWSKP